MPQRIKKRILEVLQQEKREMTVEEIAEKIGETRLPIVKGQLTRLVKEGKVVEIEKGKRYKIAE